ncbi:hypothetical protein [Naumannella cuiyingiana]|uniref:Uncharacterized protein n=1 Tax=Naumannella cuiyingiana TaxID=1347891 RepID=A0A7Z0IK17_9ACTN|nr:hypothetical protein [Naumannella cuiyingiana]NYI70038.1 hypothetical protein [Naumannella cuiyingiana]
MLIPLEAEVVNHLPMPAYVFGIVAFLLLIGLLQLVRGVGKGRPHS